MITFQFSVTVKDGSSPMDIQRAIVAASDHLRHYMDVDGVPEANAQIKVLLHDHSFANFVRTE